MLVTSGVLFGAPSSELLFTSKPLSSLIAGLYILNLNYSWYTIILLASLSLFLFGYFMILDLLLHISNLKQKVGAVLLLIAPFLYFILIFFELNFTQVAILSSGIGTLIALIHERVLGKTYGIILIALGIFWRDEAGLLSLGLVISLFLIYDSFRFSSFSIKSLILRLTPIFIVAASAWFLTFLNTHHNSPIITQEKKDYIYHFNALSKTLDYIPTSYWVKNVSQSANSIGWSKNDFRLYIYEFYYANSEIYSSQNLLKLAEYSSPKSLIQFNIDVIKQLNTVLLSQHKILILFLLLTTVIATLIISPRRIKHLMISYTLLYIINFYILSLGRIPERVLLPLVYIFIISIIMMLYFYTDTNKKDVTIKASKSKFVGVLSLVILLYILVLDSMNNSYIKVNNEFWWKEAGEKSLQNFDNILNFVPDKPIIAFSSFYSTLMKTYSPTRSPITTEPIWRNIILIGWTIKSPEMSHRLEELGINNDLFSSFLTSEAYLATSERDKEIKLVDRYLAEHSNSYVIWEVSPLVFNGTGVEIIEVDTQSSEN